MSFSDFLKEHYETARNDATNDADARMIESLTNGNCQTAQVRTWMTNYGLFQGIDGDTRTIIANAFLNFANDHKRLQSLGIDEAKSVFEDLLGQLFDARPRSWISATSKLLWCIYPKDMAIYDSFVHRSLTVLQSLEPALSNFKPLGDRPRINGEEDIKAAGEHYGNYLTMIKCLIGENQAFLNEQGKNRDKQPPDIRIIDKILWMIGDPNTAQATKKY